MPFVNLLALIFVGAMLCSYFFGSGLIARRLVGFLAILIVIMAIYEGINGR